MTDLHSSQPVIGCDVTHPRAAQSGLLRTGGIQLVRLLALLVALLALVPLGFVAVITVQTGWETAVTLIFRARVGELLVNTLLLEFLTIPLAIILAVTLAWLIERTDLPGRRMWAWLAVAPLGIPAFVHAYGWVSVMPAMNGLGGALLISVLAYTPFLYLPVSSQLRRLDPALEDVAASLGLGPLRVFLRVVVPQLRLAICGGSLLIGLHLLAEYGLYALIGFDTISTVIFDQFQSAYNGPAANMLAGVLVLVCFTLLALENWLRGNASYARIGSGAPGPAPLVRLGWSKGVWIAIPLLTGILALGVPLLTLGRWLMFGGVQVWQIGPIANALTQTLLLSVAGALATTFVALPMAWLSIRAPGRMQRILEACHSYVGSLPGIVVALALVTITVRVALPLYQTAFTLILAYCLIFLPRALVSLRASIAQAPVELERVAQSLGKTPFRAAMQITMRLCAPGFAASCALTALGITTELTATLMLAPNGTTTLSTRFWSLSSEIDYAGAAPYALGMVMVSLPLTLFLLSQSRRAAGQ